MHAKKLAIGCLTLSRHGKGFTYPKANSFAKPCTISPRMSSTAIATVSLGASPSRQYRGSAKKKSLNQIHIINFAAWDPKYNLAQCGRVFTGKRPQAEGNGKWGFIAKFAQSGKRTTRKL